MSHKQLRAIDRLPIICAAGKQTKLSEPVSEVLKEYPKEELAEKLVKQNLNLWKPIEHASSILPQKNQVEDILAPDLNKSRFLEFKDQFYEKIYCKKVPLGRPMPTNSKPDHVTNESVTFGKFIPKSEKAYDIALPKRSTKEVLKEFVKWHDKYVVSHRSYFPSEQIRRGYNEKFNKNQVFGKRVNADVTGKMVKCILQDPQNSKAFIINKHHAEYIGKHNSLLGKSLRRQKYDLNPDTTFGRSSPSDEFNAKKLLTSSVSPKEASQYANETTYRLFANDLNYSSVDCRIPAGKTESLYPIKRSCKFLAENLGEETTVKQLISPTIPFQFGLSHRDFLLPRSKEQIRRIFSKSGFELGDDEHFEKVWSLALSEWTSIGDSVSIEAFRYALDKINRNTE